MQDQVGIIIDDKGQPMSSAFTFPARPSALAATGGHVLAAFQDAVHVYDVSSSERIQSLPLLPAQAVAGEHQLRAVKDSSSPRILIATSRKVRQGPLLHNAPILDCAGARQGSHLDTPVCASDFSFKPGL